MNCTRCEWFLLLICFDMAWHLLWLFYILVNKGKLVELKGSSLPKIHKMAFNQRYLGIKTTCEQKLCSAFSFDG